MTEFQSNIGAEKSRKSKHLPSTVWFIIISLAVLLGFVAGTYKYDIIAAIGPIFGAKSHAGSLDFSSLQETYNKLASNYDGKLDDKLLVEGANRGLVAAAGDDYTLYMSSKEATDFNNSLSGNIGGGIGAEIGIKNDEVIIIRALKNNPAEKVGLNANDVILDINDQSTNGWTVEKAVSAIRGDVGTTVKLTIQRGDTIKDFVITRDIINSPSVDSNVIDGVGVLTIGRFDDKTAGLAKLAAQDFKKQAVKAIILDLRGNGGGYVNAAKDVVGLWLNNKIVMTEKIGGVIEKTLQTGNDAILAGLPTVVLINGGSASASEITAGALRDNKVAKLVGEKTFGKGSMQQILPLDNGAQLKVTVARWYTPDDINLDKNGLIPDNVITITQDDINKGVDTQMNEAKRVLGL